MFCKICDLITDIPLTGDMVERIENYKITDEGNSADIIIRADLYNLERWPVQSEAIAIYLESGFHFYKQLIKFDGLMLHASAVEFEGKAYLFSANTGVGKSTHTGLWQRIYGEKAQVFNDDKPALRRIDGKWYAYGTPWCGKDGINQNKKVPLGGICFVKRGEHNKIRKLTIKDAMISIVSQSTRKITDVVVMDKFLSLTDTLVREIPIFELECLPNKEAAILSSTTMCRAAQEGNL